ncbi:putative Ig domain-containing protein [Paraneptunicella aestuarii]|uniref:putative Ig domain-containing protein n=1 Tax=Paraneptunicella aestuarii TaxID=2831148 RepID=UPI001E626A18|nr:putative Ig domain-containing protein [Paraneptunicella aestuarii]UAA38395.1 putative Ig domain-containing protein [Paraneptunicella aestuarii]
MVAVVTGDLAGLFNSSLSALGQAGTHGQAQTGQSRESVYVNAATGNLIIQGQDERLAALGMNIGVLRTYNSMGTFEGDIDNWRLGFLSSISLEGELNTVGSSIRRITADGSAQIFHYDESLGYTSVQGSGAHDKLQIDATTQEVTYIEGSSQNRMQYASLASGGKLLAILNWEGKGQHFSYSDTTGLLESIITDTDTSVETTTLTYNSDGNLTALVVAEENEALSIYEYEYDDQKRLTAILVDLNPGEVDSPIYETRYTYVSPDSKLIQTLSQSDGTSLSFSYDSQNRVESITNGNQEETNYSYVDTDTTKVIVNGNTYTFDFDSKGQLTQKSVSVNGQDVATQYEYDASGNVVSITNGLGLKTEFGYDDQGNVIWEQDASGNRIERYYENELNLLLKETFFAVPDPDGLQGVESAAAPQSIRYVYQDSTKQLLYKISPEGYVTEYRYNSLNQLSDEIIYRAADASELIGSLGENDHPSRVDLEAWVGEFENREFAPHDISLVSYTYDFRGNLASRTVFKEVNVDGEGVSPQVTTFTYDAAGRLLSETDSTGHSRAFTYDGLGRIKTETAPDNSLTQYVYSDAQQKISITSANGFLTTQTYDDAGRLILIEYGKAGYESALGNEKWFYDEQGREVARQHQNGSFSYSVYDEANRLKFSIDVTGAVTQFVYDAAGQVVRTLSYANLVDTSSWMDTEIPVISLPADLSNAEGKDRETWHFYDNSGLKTYDVDAAGYVTAYQYNGLGQTTQTTRYATAITIPIQDLTTSPAITTHAEDRSTQFYYNSSGQLLAEMTTHSFTDEVITQRVTEYFYDRSGNLIGQLTYLQDTDELVANAGDITQVVSKLNADTDARLEQWLYNGANQVIAHIDEQGKQETFTYNSDGQLETSTEHAVRFALNWLLGDLDELPAYDANTDFRTTYTYNESGLISTQTQAHNGAVTEYFYNDVGQRIGTKVGERQTLIERDILGRVVTSLNGEESATVTDITVENIATLAQSKGAHQTWDNQGRLISSTDAEGNINYFFYDSADRLSAVINALGEVEQYEFNAFGELVSTRTYANHLAINALDASVLASGDIGEVAVNLSSLVSVQDTVVEQSYTKRGLLDIQQSNGGSWIDNDYNAFGEVKQSTTLLSDGHHRVDSYGYNLSGGLSSTVIDTLGASLTQRIEYDAFGRVIKATDANGVETHYQFDDKAGKVIQLKQVQGRTEKTSVEYDVFGRQVKVTNALNKTTVTQYDNANRKELVVEPNGDGTEITYNAYGEVTDIKKGSVVDGVLTSALEHTRFEYDKNGNRVKEISGFGSPEAITTAYVFNDNNQRTHTIVDPDGEALTTEYRYDAAGRVKVSINASGYVAQYFYDAKGQLTYVIGEADSVTHYTYDLNGRRTSQSVYVDSLRLYLDKSLTDPSEALETESVAPVINTVDGWVQRFYPNNVTVDTIESNIAAADKRTQYFVYDNGGRQILTIDAAGGVKQNVFDAAGRVIQQNQYSNELELTGSQINDLIAGQLDTVELAALLPAGNSSTDKITASVYDANGQVRFSLHKTLDGKAIVKESVYDEAGRVIRTIAYSTPISFSGVYTESQIIALIDTSAADRTTQFYYDEAGRLRFEINSLKGITEYQYDAVGQLHKTLVFDLDNISISGVFSSKLNSGTLTYDDLSSGQTPLGSLPVQSNARITTTEYDRAGRVSSIVDAEGKTESWTYNSVGQKDTYTNKKGNVWHYYYDGAGRVAREIGPVVENIGEQKNGSIIIVENARIVREMEYDSLGNVTHITNGYVTSNTASSPVLDAKTSVMGYDAQGRQTHIFEAATTGSPKTVSKVTYNALGQAVVNHIQVNTLSGVKNVYSYKVYDEVGRVAFDIDSEGYVTEYRYDALGNQTHIVRYEKQINPGSGEEIEIGDIDVSTLGNSRAVENAYDTLGRKTSSKQPAIVYAELDSQGNIATKVGQPETVLRYNAFGELTEKLERRNSAEWSREYYYYDKLGNRTHFIDAGQYLTEWKYNDYGEVIQVIEYAEPLSSIPSSGKPSPDKVDEQSESKNRYTSFAYDKLGRVRFTTQKDVVYQAENAVVKFTYDDQIDNSVTENRYDELGNVTHVIKNGQQTSTVYDAQGSVISVSAGFAQVVTNSTTLNYGALASSQTSIEQISHYVTDAHGNVLQITQESDGDTTTQSIQDRVTRQFYNENNQLVKLIDAEGNITEFEYDFAGKQIKRTQAWEEYQHEDTNFFLSSREIPEEGFTASERNDKLPAWLNFDYQTGILSGTATERFHEEVTLIVTDVAGDVVFEVKFSVEVFAGMQVNVDVKGLQPESGSWDNVDVPKTIYKKAVTNYAYNDIGQQTSISYLRYEGDNPASLDLVAKEGGAQFEYNAYGEVVAKGDRFFNNTSGTATLQEQYRYNDAGYLEAGQGQDGIKRAYLYDLQGHRVWQGNTNWSGQEPQAYSISRSYTQTSTVLYDELGRALKEFTKANIYNAIEDENTPEIVTTSQKYDRWGNVIQVTNAHGDTYNYEFNHNNQLIKESRPLSRHVSDEGEEFYARPEYRYYYDLDGRLIARIDANGNATHRRYNQSGLLAQDIDATGGVTQYGYNIFDEQVAVQDALGFIRVQTLDHLGRVVEQGDITTDTNNAESYTRLKAWQYNALGQRVVETNAAGAEFYYRYDTQGNLLRSRTPEKISISYEYDRRGNRTVQRYDNLANANGANSNKDINTWTYNYYGQMQSLNDLGENTVRYQYDQNGQLKEVKIDLKSDGKIEQIKTYENDYGSLMSISSTNGSGVDSGIYSEFGYDELGRVIFEKRTTKNTLGQSTTEYLTTVYDSLGRIDSVTVRAQGDNTDEKILLSAIQYHYDAMGNRRLVQAFNGYSGNYVVEQNHSPVLLSDFEGFSYPPATANATEYEAILGNINNIIYDEDGDIPSVVLLDQATQLEISWLQANIDATGQLIISLKPGNKVPVELANSLQEFVIKVQDGNTNFPDSFTIIPFKLPVVQNQGPRFKSGTTGFDTPLLEPGTVIDYHIQLEDFIEDPENNAISFSVEVDETTGFPNEWLEYDYDALTKTLSISTKADLVVPEFAIGESFKLHVIATDVNATPLTTDFELELTVDSASLILPDEGLYLKEDGVSFIDLFDYFSGGVEGVEFKIVDSLEPKALIQEPALVGNIIKIDSSAFITQATRNINIEIYKNGEFVSSTPTDIELQTRPRVDPGLVAEHLSPLKLSSSGRGFFMMPVFQDANSDPLDYYFEGLVELGLDFEIKGVSPDQKLYKVEYWTNDKWPGSIADGKLKILAEQTDDPTMKTELVVDFVTLNFEPVPSKPATFEADFERWVNGPLSKVVRGEDFYIWFPRYIDIEGQQVSYSITTDPAIPGFSFEETAFVDSINHNPLIRYTVPKSAANGPVEFIITVSDGHNSVEHRVQSQIVEPTFTVNDELTNITIDSDDSIDVDIHDLLTLGTGVNVQIISYFNSVKAPFYLENGHLKADKGTLTPQTYENIIRIDDNFGNRHLFTITVNALDINSPPKPQPIEVYNSRIANFISSLRPGETGYFWLPLYEDLEGQPLVHTIDVEPSGVLELTPAYVDETEKFQRYNFVVKGEAGTPFELSINAYEEADPTVKGEPVVISNGNIVAGHHEVVSVEILRPDSIILSDLIPEYADMRVLDTKYSFITFDQENLTLNIIPGLYDAVQDIFSIKVEEMSGGNPTGRSELVEIDLSANLHLLPQPKYPAYFAQDFATSVSQPLANVMQGEDYFIWVPEYASPSGNAIQLSLLPTPSISGFASSLSGETKVETRGVEDNPIVFRKINYKIPAGAPLGNIEFLLTVSDGVGQRVERIQSTINPATFNVVNLTHDTPGNVAVSWDVLAGLSPNSGVSLSLLELIDPPAGLSIQNNTIVGTLTNPVLGPNNFKVVVTDSVGNSTKLLVTLQVGEDYIPPPPPAWEGATDLTWLENQYQEISVADRVTGTGPFTFTTGDVLPDGITLSEDGLFYGQPDFESSGAHPITIIVTDSLGQTKEQAFTINITDVNRNVTPPSHASLVQAIRSQMQNLSPGQTGSFTFPAWTDPDGDQIYYTASGGGLSFTTDYANTTTETVTVDFVVPSGITASYDFTITIEATDNKGASSSLSVTGNSVTYVNIVPVWSPIPTQYFKEGQYKSVSLAGYASDDESLVFGALNLPAGMTLTSAGVLQGSPYSTTAGNHTIHILATDASGNSTGTTFTLSIENTNQGPSWNPITTRYGEAAKSFSFNVSPYAYDNDGETLTFSSPNLPSGLTMSTSGLISGTLGSALSGNYTITAVARDPSGSTATINFTLNVTPVNKAPIWVNIPAQTATEGETFRLNVSAYASDPEHGALTYSSPSLPSGLSISSSGVISGTPTASAVGNHTITVVATDPKGATASKQFSLAIAAKPVNKAPTWTGTNHYYLTEGVSFNINLGSLATDPEGHSITFSSTSLPSGISISSSGTFSGTPAVGTAGSYGFTVTATDQYGAQSSKTFGLTVSNGNRLPYQATSGDAESRIQKALNNVTPGSSGVFYLNKWLDSDNDSLSYSLSSSKGISFSIGAPNPLTGSMPVSYSVPSNASGTFSVTLTVSDGTGTSSVSVSGLSIGSGGGASAYSTFASAPSLSSFSQLLSPSSVVTQSIATQQMLETTTSALTGGTGDDTFYFNLGDGHQTLSDDGGVDTLVFGAGITKDVITFVANQDKLIINISATDSITVENWVQNGLPAIESIQFDNGDILSSSDILQRLQLTATDGDDTVDVSNLARNLSYTGGIGNDTIYSGTGNDRFYFNLGDGHDVISDTSGIELLFFGEGITTDDITFSVSGDDLVITLSANDSITFKNWIQEGKIALEGISFNDGSYISDKRIGQILRIQGTDGDDILDYSHANTELHYVGGKGNDTIHGGTDLDKFHFNVGDGHDVITDLGGIDIIYFGTGINKDALTFTVDANDLVIHISATDSITVKDWLQDGKVRIEGLSFADGGYFSDRAISQRVQFVVTDGDDVIDLSHAQTDLNHTAGKGNDTIHGGSSFDHYYFNVSDGHDVISDAGGSDVIHFGTGINKDALTFNVDANDLVIHISATDSITVKDWLQDGKVRIEGLSFADGGYFTDRSISQRVQFAVTDGDDVIDLSHAQTDLNHTAGKGNDTIHGGSSFDHYYFNVGDGHDLITDAGGSDVIHFGPGILKDALTYTADGENLVIHISDNDSITIKNWLQDGLVVIEGLSFDNGDYETGNGIARNLSIVGTDGDDVIDLSSAQVNLKFDGSLGDDTLIGGAGHDEYTYRLGDGHDTISDVSGLNVIRMMDFNKQDLRFVRYGDDLLIRFNNTSGSVRIQNWLTDPNAQSFSLVITDYTLKPEHITPLLEDNLAPVYVGDEAFTIEAGSFVRIPVTFIDPEEVSLSLQATNVPEWLTWDPQNSELYGNVPSEFEGQVNVNVTAIDTLGETAAVTLNLTVAKPREAVITSIDMAPQTVGYQDVVSIDVAGYFADLVGSPDITVEVKNANGIYQVAGSEYWLQVVNGELVGTASIEHVTDKPLELRVTATDELGDRVEVETQLRVEGPFAKKPPTIEAVATKEFVLDVSQYFKGLSENASYGIRIEAPAAAPAALSVQTAGGNSLSEPALDYNALLSTSSLVTANEVSFLSSSEPTVQSTTSQSTTFVDIPEEYQTWLTFDPQTGLLTGTPPAELVANLVVEFSAQDGEITLTTSTNLDIDENAKVEEYWFTYDAANRVTIDSGAMLDGTIVLGTTGQYLEYDAAGRNNLIISAGGYKATYMDYNQRGQLTDAFSTIWNFSKENLTKVGSTNIDYYSDRLLNPGMSAENYVQSKRHIQTVQHSYNNLGQVTETQNYYSEGKEQEIRYFTGETDDTEHPEYESIWIDVAGFKADRQVFDYNADGKLNSTTTYGMKLSAWGTWESRNRNFVLDLHGGFEVDGTWEEKTFLAQNYSQFTLTTSEAEHTKLRKDHQVYDGVGRLQTVTNQQYQISGVDTKSYSYEYEGREQYLEKLVSGVGIPTNSNEGASYLPGESKSHYDAEGNRIAVESYLLNKDGKRDKDSEISARHFDYSASGNLVKKQSGTQTNAISSYVTPTAASLGFKEGRISPSHYLYANNQYLGEFNEDGEVNIRHQHFESVDPGNVGSSSRFTVQPGQNLRQIATLFYGNADYWYIIADANGLDADGASELTEGQLLEIPERQTNENRFDVFKPDNIIDKIGSTAAPLAYVPPPQEAGCNMVATLLIVAVAIVVTVATAGALAAASGQSIWAAGATALSGGAGVTGAVAAGVGGFVGSLAGQATGIALGVQSGFDLKGAFVSGLTAGITAGAGSYLRGAEWAFEAGKFTEVGKAALAATSAISSAAANKLVGRPSGFSWANVAVAAGTAAIASHWNLDGGPISEGGLLSDEFASDIAGGFARAGISYGIKKGFFNKGSWNFENVATDVFGNAIGNSIVRTSQKTATPKMSKEDLLASTQLSDLYSGAISDTDTVQQLMERFGISEIPSHIGTELSTDPEKLALLDEVMQQKPDLSYEEASQVANLLDAKRDVDDINSMLASVSSDTKGYDTLLRTSKLLSTMLINKDVYFDSSLTVSMANGNEVSLLPTGISRVTGSDLYALSGFKDSDFVDKTTGYFGALYRNNSITNGAAQYIYANRGTDTGIDWVTNIADGMGFATKQFTKALGLADAFALNDKLNGNIEFTGHSLGGGLAAAQSLRTGFNSITLNAKGLSDSTISRHHLNVGYSDRIAAFNLQGEILSSTQDSWLVEGALKPAGTLLKNIVATGNMLIDFVSGDQVDTDAFGVMSLDSAYGNREVLSSYNFDGTQMSSYQRIANTLDLHGMDYIISSTRYALHNGQLTADMLKHIRI